MILVVLAVVWVVALTPMVVRRLSDRQFASGLRSYRRRLLRLGPASTPPPVAGSVPGAMIGFSIAAQRLHDLRHPHEQFEARAVTDVPEEAAVAAPVSVSASPATAARRRQVVTLLAGATLLFFVLGIIPSARVLWDLGLLTLGCSAAYVALLIHFHRLAVERAQKVIALETRRHVSAELQTRRHVIALDHARQVAVGGGYSSGYAAQGYASGGTPFGGPTGSALSGSGWAVTGVCPQAASRR